MLIGPLFQCDEEDPCGNCVKRNERCIRAATPFLAGHSSGHSTPTPAPTSVPMPREISLSPLLDSSDAESEGGVNLLHMELFHHFEKHTVPTLIFQEIWPAMLQLSFKVCVYLSLSLYIYIISCRTSHRRKDQDLYFLT